MLSIQRRCVHRLRSVFSILNFDSLRSDAVEVVQTMTLPRDEPLNFKSNHWCALIISIFLSLNRIEFSTHKIRSCNFAARLFWTNFNRLGNGTHPIFGSGMNTITIEKLSRVLVEPINRFRKTSPFFTWNSDVFYFPSRSEWNIDMCVREFELSFDS